MVDAVPQGAERSVADSSSSVGAVAPDSQHKIRNRTQRKVIENSWWFTRSSGFDKQLLKEDSSGHECCFEERRASARYYKLVSLDDNINLLKHGANDHQNTSSQMEISESLTVEESIGICESA